MATQGIAATVADEVAAAAGSAMAPRSDKAAEMEIDDAAVPVQSARTEMTSRIPGIGSRDLREALLGEGRPAGTCLNRLDDDGTRAPGLEASSSKGVADRAVVAWGPTPRLIDPVPALDVPMAATVWRVPDATGHVRAGGPKA